MDEPTRAEHWLQRELDVARAAFRVQPPGPRDLTLEQYEAQLRSRVAACLRPTRQYVGLSLDAATALAADSGDALCVHRGTTGHRASWLAARVHVDVDADDRVLTASLDTAPWALPR